MPAKPTGSKRYRSLVQKGVPRKVAKRIAGAKRRRGRSRKR